jgi:Domain of unknown function (DUF4262)
MVLPRPDPGLVSGNVTPSATSSLLLLVGGYDSVFLSPSVRWRANWCRTMIGQKTDRARFLRRRKLESDEVKLLDDVEKYGCHIIKVCEEGGFPGWSYTIGLGDVLGCPEVIVIGLKEGVAHSLLNECSLRLQQGIRLDQGSRARELLANVEGEFRQVEKRWLRQTRGAVWFYGGDDFSALQCIRLGH